MIQAIRHTVGRAVVSNRHTNSHTHRRRRLECLIHRRHGLLGPGRFGTTPTDGNHRRLIGAVVYRGCDCIQKAGVRVLRKVSDDLYAGRDRAGHFNIQHHLGIWPVWVSGWIVAAIAD